MAMEIFGHLQFWVEMGHGVRLVPDGTTLNAYIISDLQ